MTRSGASAPLAWHDDLQSAFRDVRIVVVGDAILDEYVTGDCTRLSPEAPVPILRVRSIRAVPGGAANTAANMAALGGQPVLISTLGSDAGGTTLQHLLESQGVAASFAADSRPTNRKVRALGGQQQLLRLDYEDDGQASADVRAAVIDAVRTHVAGAASVVVSDYAKGLLDAPALASIVTLARDAGVPVIVDPRPEHGPWYRGCDYLTPNWKEALALAGMTETIRADDSAIETVGRLIVERYEASVILTLGSRGIRFFGAQGGESVHVDACAREVYDVSGAGDTVVAAFALAIGAGADITTALRLANAAAGVVVGRLGTTVVTAEDLESAVRRQGPRS